MRTAAALVNIAFVPEIDAGQRHQFNGRKPILVRREIEMSVELIGHRLRIVGVVKQQIANEVGPAVRPPLQVSHRKKQVVPELGIRRKVLINTGYRRLCGDFPILDIRLQQFAECGFSVEQGLCQRPGDDHGVRAFQGMAVSLCHPYAKHINETLGNEDKVPLEAHWRRIIPRHRKRDFSHERHKRTPRLNVGR